MKCINASTASHPDLYAQELGGNRRVLGIVEHNSQGSFAEAELPGPSSRPTPPLTKQTQTYFPEYGLGLRRLLASDSEAVSLRFSLWWFPSFVCLPGSCFFAGVQKAFTLSWGWAVRRLVLFRAETQLLWTAACKFYCVLAYFLCVTRSFRHVFSTCIQGMFHPIFALSNIILDRAMKII